MDILSDETVLLFCLSLPPYAGPRTTVGSTSDSWARGPGFDTQYGHTFVAPSADSRRAVVSCWWKHVHKVLINPLGGLSLPRKSVVWLTDHRCFPWTLNNNTTTLPPILKWVTSSRKEFALGANSFLEEWIPFKELCPPEKEHEFMLFPFIKLMKNMEVGKSVSEHGCLLGLNKNCSRWHFNILVLSFEENKAWFFMWILCLAKDSHELSSHIFSGRQGKNIYECCLLQSWLAL